MRAGMPDVSGCRAPSRRPESAAKESITFARSGSPKFLGHDRESGQGSEGFAELGVIVGSHPRAGEPMVRSQEREGDPDKLILVSNEPASDGRTDGRAQTAAPARSASLRQLDARVPDGRGLLPGGLGTGTQIPKETFPVDQVHDLVHRGI